MITDGASHKVPTVSHVPMNISLEEISQEAEHIVVLEENGQKENYYEVTLPKNTHHKKERKTVYREDVVGFKVIEVLKSAKLKVGQNIFLWQKPDYSL